MINRTMTCVTSLAALVLAAPLAFAQEKPDKAQDRAPSQKMENNAGASERGLERSGGQPNQKAGETTRERASGAERGGGDKGAKDQGTEQRKDARDEVKDQRKDVRDEAKDKRKDVSDEAKDKRKDVSDEAKDRRKDAKEERKDDDTKRGDHNERAGSNRDRRDEENAVDSKQQDKSRDRAGDADRDGERNRDQAKDRDQSKDRDQADGAVREEDRQRAEQVRSKVDNKERERVREVAFRGDVRRATNVNVRINIGVRLPRQVEIYDLPSDVVEIVPAYRGYRYVVVGDDYCIIDPETYVIVDVIHRGGGNRGEYAYRSGSGSARLELTNDQIEIIRREIRERGRKFDYDGDLEVGIELPGDFAFEPFPDLVVRAVPVIRDYRFVHVEDEIAIVAPDKPDVVYVIEN